MNLGSMLLCTINDIQLTTWLCVWEMEMCFYCLCCCEDAIVVLEHCR